jgi:hypothetical protein
MPSGGGRESPGRRGISYWKKGKGKVIYFLKNVPFSMLKNVPFSPMLDIDDEARSLAERIILLKGVPAEYPEDALHIAVAAVNGMEIIITWNFAHLNNPFTRKTVREIVEGEGYQCPEICSPEELLEVDK